MLRLRTSTTVLSLLLSLLTLLACGGEETTSPRDASGSPSGHPLLGSLAESVLGTDESPDGPGRVMVASASNATPAAAITVDEPLDGSVFPPEFIPPTFLWRDPEPDVDTWLIEIGFSDPSAKPVTVIVPGAPPPMGEVDLEAFSANNEPYEGTPEQRSAVSWTPSRDLWEELKRLSVEAPATLTFTGFASGDLEAPRSRGVVRITTSKDPVGASLFYRDVPLMPAVSEEAGRIKPLAENALPLIAWRLRDVSQPESKLILKGMATCGNCHSFSLDGKTLGMDVDGPTGDKGMYAITSVQKETEIGRDDVITWNSFPDKPEGHKTIGFMSRVSPDGRFVASTVNEALYVSNFLDFRFLQVFFPTRGILAYYSRDDGGMRALPGADDPEFVHCSPSWTPDGKQLVFSRARAFDPYTEGQEIARVPNDPNEPQVRYDLYRIPFDEGRGGTPIRVEGASENGMSNSFPKVSPDGKWIVFVKAKNGLLMRPDGRLWIVPIEGGEAREMRCNTRLMNSWHSFAPNGRWMVFSSKSRTPYTQAFLTHIDEDGNDSPAIVVPNCTAANRAVNLPEFLNATADALDSIQVPAVDHYVYTQAAERLATTGEHAEAILLLEKAVELDPTFVHAIVRLGYELMQVGRHETAIVHLERAVALAPKDPFGNFNLGVSLRLTGRPHRAIPILEHLLVVAPDFPNARTQLTRALLEAGQREDRLRELEAALRNEGNDVGARHELANLYQRTGRLEDAIEQFVRVIEREPKSPESLSDLAWLLCSCPEDGIRDGERAVRLATRAVEITDAKHPERLMVLAAAFAETGRHEEAVATENRALALVKDSEPVLAAEIESRVRLHRQRRPIRSASER